MGKMTDIQALLIAIGITTTCIGVCLFLAVRDWIRSRKERNVWPDWAHVPPLEGAVAFMNEGEAPLYIFPSTKCPIELLDIFNWTEEFIDKWLHAFSGEKVRESISNAKVVMIDLPFLEVPDTAMASALAFPDQRVIFISAVDLYGNMRNIDTLKSLYFHELGHLVLFQCRPDLNNTDIQGQHHAIIKSVLNC